MPSDTTTVPAPEIETQLADLKARRRQRWLRDNPGWTAAYFDQFVWPHIERQIIEDAERIAAAIEA